MCLYLSPFSSIIPFILSRKLHFRISYYEVYYILYLNISTVHGKMVIDRFAPLLPRMIGIVVSSRLVSILHHLLHHVSRYAVFLDGSLYLVSFFRIYEYIGSLRHTSQYVVSASSHDNARTFLGDLLDSVARKKRSFRERLSGPASAVPRAEIRL